MAFRTLDLRGFRGSPRDLAESLPRPVDEQARSSEAVAAILEEVRRDGDTALARLSERFDGVVPPSLRVPTAEVEAALGRVPTALRQTLGVAADRIRAYHAHEASPAPPDFDDGTVRVRHLVRPVDRAGCYAPGGRARYPSTVLMCAVPARVAGVAEVVLCVPPGPDGAVDDATLAAAAVAGVDEVYAVGGAQAVAAMAFGTETIAAVDVVVGPGNRYVAEAKRQVSGVVGVASAFAGPSEVVVIAGPDTPPAWAAADLVVQAEHGPDGLAWLVTWSAEVAAAVDGDVAALVAASPRRADLEATLGGGGYIVLVDGPDQAVAVANVVAPEHLEILVEDAERLLEGITSAAAIFLGPLTPASVGDYVAGPNHVLPTNRTARFASALRVDDFRRHLHAVSLDEAGLAALGPHVITLATTEGLPGHADAVRIRQPR